MNELHLVIGNKNYSSWSLRPWLAMKATGLTFRETLIPLDLPETAKLIAEHSPAGKVPVLHHGDIAVWESLAILEYLAETFPSAGLWPKDAKARALARSVSSVMHAGFSSLRNACPMNLRRQRNSVAMDKGIVRDVEMIEALWRDCRKRFGQDGPFLFGAFSAADAMYAPVVTRFDTYDIAVTADTKSYMSAILDHPAFLEWREAGIKEPWTIAADEVD